MRKFTPKAPMNKDTDSRSRVGPITGRQTTRSPVDNRAPTRRYGVWLAVRNDGSGRTGTVIRRAGPVVVRVRRPSPRGLGAAAAVVAGPAPRGAGRASSG